MHNALIKNTKNLVTLHMFHITNCLILEICWQKLNKKISNIVSINSNINIVFSQFKVGDLFSVKESVPKYLRSFVVYRFTCPDCNASYIGETICDLTTRIKEHLETDSKPHIFKHLDTNRKCNELWYAECFEIIDSVTSSYRLKLKEVMYITWKKPSLNKQVKHVSINYLVIYCLTLFHLFCYCYCFHNHVALILFKINSLIC